MSNTYNFLATMFLAAGGVFAQTTPGLTFDAASVKPAAPVDMAAVMQQAMRSGEMPKIGMRVDPGRVEFTYVDLKSLLIMAYKVKPNQISGPDWLASTRFDIVAKFPSGATRADIPQMLQALLKERLKLETHMEPKENPMLALVVGKGGPKLKESTESPVAIDENAPLKPGERKIDGPDGQIRMSADPKTGETVLNMGLKGTMVYRMVMPKTAGGDMTDMKFHLEGRQITMDGFADLLSQFSQMGGGGGRAVVDLTGLKSHYEVSMEFAYADLLNIARSSGMDTMMGGTTGPAGSRGSVPDASDPGSGRSLYASVQALGLRLEQRKVVIDQLIIDRLEKVPVEN